MGEALAHARDREGLSAIEWIKKYRAIAGCTLREAKDAYDAGRAMPASRAEIEEALERDAKRQAMNAAAPDMFEALLSAQKWLAKQTAAPDDLQDAIDAALAKAAPSRSSSVEG